MDTNEQSREAFFLEMIAKLSDRVHALEARQGLESAGDFYAYCGLLMCGWESSDYTLYSDAKDAGKAHCNEKHGGSSSHIVVLKR
jgi:hypothetical protein